MGNPKDSLPEIQATLRWRLNRGLSWIQIAECARLRRIVWNNVPQIPTTTPRLASALAAWSSWASWKDEDSDWVIACNELSLHIIAIQPVEEGQLVRGLVGFRAEVMPGEDVEHYVGRCD